MTLTMMFYVLSSVTASPGDLAIIVNESNSATQVSLIELKKILKLEKQYWKNGEKIYLVLREAGSPEKEITMKKVYKMKKDEELKKFWLAKMYRGEISSFPRILDSNEAVKRFVSRVPYSIGFINASALDKSVRVLRVEGKLPGEKGYILGD